MPNLNRVFLMGNLTKDPELRYSGTGIPIVNLRLAINSRYKTQSGELKEDVCYITAVVFGKQAVPCNDYLKKGSPVFVEGKLQSRSWESNGQKKSTIEVKVDRVQFISRKGEDTPIDNEERYSSEKVTDVGPDSSLNDLGEE